MKIPSTNTC